MDNSPLFLIFNKIKKPFRLYLFIFIPLAIVCQSLLMAQNKIPFPEKFPDPVFEHLTMADGLPENSVRCILQDHLGYMWFGTQKGLVKYDGYNMTVYQKDQDDSLGISNSQIRTIYEDKSGTLWIGTHGGLNRFDQTMETFTSYIHDPKDSSSINSNFVSHIYEYKAGKLLVGTDLGLNLFDQQTGKFKEIFLQDSTFSPVLYEYINSLMAKGNRISSILQVGDNADLSKTFTIRKKTIVLVIIMGERGFDYGWLENVNGEIVAGLNNNNIFSAGGNQFNQIQILTDTLNIGEYRLNYVSDEGYSYNSFREMPPEQPEYWGIQVIELGDEESDIGELMDTKQTTPIKFKVGDFIEDSLTGNLVVGIGNKTWLFDKGNESLTEYYNNTSLKNKLGEIRSFLQIRDGTVWIAHSMGLSKFNPKQKSIKRYQPLLSDIFIPENHIQQLIEDEEGLIWASSEAGLIIFNPQDEKFTRIKHDPNKSSSISRDYILSIYKDHSDIIWVGTSWAGLNKWDKNKNKIKMFKNNPTKPGNKAFRNVRHMAEAPNGIIWLGMEDGLFSFNPLSSEFRNYQYNPIRTQGVQFNITDFRKISSYSSGANIVSEIHIDNSGIVWFGTHTKGLGRFDAVRNIFSFYSHDPNDSSTISHNAVRHLLADDDILWIGTTGGGLSRFDKKTKTFKNYLPDSNNPQSLSHGEVSGLLRDKAGSLWIVVGALNRFDETTETFTSFTLGPEFTITTIYEDQNRQLWVGNSGLGLYVFDRKTEKRIHKLSEQDGLANNTVRSILEDDSGNLWIGTANGLSKFNPKTNTIKSYFNSDRFVENRNWRYSATKTMTGEMIFGNYEGFVMFHPDSIKDDPVPPKVVISNVSLFNRPQKKISCDDFIPQTNELNLLYDENDLRFDYVGLHFGEPQKNQYKYMLENFDEDWIEAGVQRNATYTNLDAGEYIFRVTASNRDGVWNEDGASLKIIIPPPFWATWWAYAIYILLFGAILFGIRSYEMNRLNWKNQFKMDEVKLQEREETDKMKSRFFANISHEFRTPLTLILGPIEKIISNTTDKDIQKQTGLIKRNASRLLSLVNQLLDLSKLEAGKLKLKASRGNIIPFLKGIVMLFESLAEQKNISLKFTADKDDIQIYFDRDQMAKILSNLLSNAFKFTADGGVITINVNLRASITGMGANDNHMLEIIVRDSGIGISEEELPKLFDQFYQVDSSQTREHEGTGIGLALINELVELHHGNIRVESLQADPQKGIAGWTEFTIELPLGRAHLNDDQITEQHYDFEEAPIADKDLSILQGKDSNPVTSSSKTTNDKFFEPDPEDEKTVILVVEDNQDVREYIKDSLGNNFQIEIATNGQQGVEKAFELIPDIIISDIMMPRMDGNELARICKNDEKTDHIPIILLTAKSEQESKLESLETGADDYLTKPFDTRELQIRIRNLINIRKKLQEKFGQGDYIPNAGGKLSNPEEQFMSKVMETIKNHISEEDFSSEQFAEELFMSRMQLHRKLKALTGKSTSLYIRSFRLSRAKKMLEAKHANVSEIAYSVGFSSPAYFSRCFKEEFGISPSELSN